MRYTLILLLSFAAMLTHPLTAAAQTRAAPTVESSASAALILADGSTTPRTATDRASEVINVLDYGAKCDGATDDARSINLATAAWRQANVNGAGALLTFPARGKCLIKSPINITNVLNFGAMLEGNSAVILCQTGGLCIDATGLNRTKIADLTILGGSVNTPTIGIQWARESDKIGCGIDKAHNLTVIGQFSFAAIYIEACESMAWTDMIVENGFQSNDAWVLVEDGINYWGAASPFQNITIGRNTMHGMDELSWINPIFTQRGPGHIMWLANSHTTQMIGDAYGLQMINGIAPIVLFDNGVGANGNLTLGMHFEAVQQQNIFEFEGSKTSPVVYGLSWHTRGSQLSGPVFLRGAGVSHVTLDNVNIQVNQFLHRPPMPKMFDDPQAWSVSGDVFLPSMDWWNQPVGWTGCVTTLTSARQCSLGTVTQVTASGQRQALVFAASGDSTYDITLSAPLVLSIAGGSPGQAQHLNLVLRQPSSGGYPVTLPTNVRWTGGNPPEVSTTRSRPTVITFLTVDGGASYLGWSN